ncbi:hypothetical protein DL95DRAFT_454716 [Leptodontidium sp. 2 PMI_412]|nr:hypothetical protein DL95DRAFT_454716 [Leptodontidium sp. 2 PMI_412]
MADKTILSHAQGASQSIPTSPSPYAVTADTLLLATAREAKRRTGKTHGSLFKAPIRQTFMLESGTLPSFLFSSPTSFQSRDQRRQRVSGMISSSLPHTTTTANPKSSNNPINNGIMSKQVTSKPGDDEKKKAAAEALALLKKKPMVHDRIIRPAAYKRGGKSDKEKVEEVHTGDTTEDEA